MELSANIVLMILGLTVFIFTFYFRKMLTKKQTLQLVVNRMLQCLDKIQEDGDKDGKLNKNLFQFQFTLQLALDELLVYRSKIVEMVNETNPDHSTKIVAAFVGRYVFLNRYSSTFWNHFRLQIFDIPTSLELLLILKDLLEQTEIQTGIFINDTMITTLRLIISLYIAYCLYIHIFVQISSKCKQPWSRDMYLRLPDKSSKEAAIIFIFLHEDYD